jgi:oligopeptide/dipeptide ABC transporter ATP-binding protein
MTEPLLEVEGLSKTFTLKPGLFGLRPGRTHKAVDEVSFSVMRGEAFGIVGESGCGKSTTARLVTRLLEPSAGQIRLAGADLLGLGSDALRRQRRAMQMVFQDPFASLNPRLTVGRQLAEPLQVHGLATGAAATGRVAELLRQVGLRPEHASRYPHEFSGGQRQRIAIARALAPAPDLIVADEPVSALDVSVRAQVLNLMRELRRATGVAVVFISHDLAVVRYVADRVAVMFAGRIVEQGRTAEVFARPHHPYTRSLLEAVPGRHRRNRRSEGFAETGGPASAEGCSYAGRCGLARERCRSERPPLLEVGPGRLSACFYADEVRPPGIEVEVATAGHDRLTRLQARFASARGAG